MRLMLEHEALGIDPARRTVQARAPIGEQTLSYDALIIATGAAPVRPRLPGVDLPSVHVLHTMDHALELQRVLNDSSSDAAVIVGAGYTGLEMAEALLQRGMRVTVVEQAPEVLPTVDPWDRHACADCARQPRRNRPHLQHRCRDPPSGGRTSRGRRARAVAARTGVRDAEARGAGLDPLTVQVVCDDHNAYYPDARHCTSP
jgi:pyridine nucleotide-disulfide oxidoreductase